jgi:hypothetical protein
VGLVSTITLRIPCQSHSADTIPPRIQIQRYRDVSPLYRNKFALKQLQSYKGADGTWLMVNDQVRWRGRRGRHGFFHCTVSTQVVSLDTVQPDTRDLTI